MGNTRICIKCEISKASTTEFFYKDKNSKDGVTTTCKECKIKLSKQWSHSNKNAKYENDKRWNLNNPQSVARYNKQWCESNPNRMSELSKQWRENNPDRSSELNKRWYASHVKDRAEYYIKYRMNNRVEFTIKSQVRRSKIRLLPATLTKEQWEYCLIFFDHKDAYTGLPMKIISQDHVIPLSKGGSYVRRNIVACEKNINSSKNNSNMEDWFRKQSFYNKERLNKIYKWIGLKNNIQQLSLY